ncbi:MAG: hypothetical protein LBN27_03550 [Prevotellaceae bacterium]|jgi:hypothetical protein|nr:hypothetical protein [Prevotellaceae bacterium]
MRKEHIKNGHQKTPDLLVKMGLDELYQEFVAYSIQREKTKRIIWVKNPPHYACKAYKVHIWNWVEDEFEIRAETMFGNKEVFKKCNLL